MKKLNFLLEGYTGYSFIEVIDYYYRKLENYDFLCNNFDLIWRCGDRADLIYEYQEIENFIELEELLELAEKHINLDAYICDLPSKSELESRELGFL